MANHLKTSLPLFVSLAAFVLPTSCTKAPEDTSAVKSGWVGDNDGQTGNYALEWTCAPKRFTANYQAGQHQKQDEYCEWDDNQKDSSDNKLCEFHTNFNSKKLNAPTEDVYHNLPVHNPNNSLEAAADITSACFNDPSGPVPGIVERHSDPSICAKVREWATSSRTYKIKNAEALGNAPAARLIQAAHYNVPVVQIELFRGNLPTGCAYVTDGTYPEKTVMRCTPATGKSCLDIAKDFKVGILFKVEAAAAPAAAPASSPSADTPTASDAPESATVSAEGLRAQNDTAAALK